MTHHLHRYLEIPAPPDVARALLAEQPPFDGVRQGEWWLWQGDLWQIEMHCSADDRMIWQGSSPALPGAHLYLSVTLHDATVTTHLTVHLALRLPGSPLVRALRERRTAGQRAYQLDRALERLRQQAQARTPAPATPPELPDDPHELADALRSTHPATVAAFETMHALPSLTAVAQLDRRWQATEAGRYQPEVYQQVAMLPATDADYDLVYAGGGLGLLHAAVMARCYGYRVLLFDRGEVGCAHREWNISDHELRALVTIGLFEAEELEQVVMRRYSDGVVRFQPDQSAVRAAELHLPDVLNVGLDAGGLLQLTRRKLEAAGGVVLDQRSFQHVFSAGPGRVVVEVSRADGRHECYGARVVLDGMGATSPLALRRFAGQPFAGVCPTVGTVVTGLEPGRGPQQHDPDVGDILISIADAQRGRQLIWEGFAGRDDELTVYVFYYDLLKAQGRTSAARSAESSQPHSLLDLFEDYFRLLPSYKRPGANFRHLKPVYGFIPARHTQRRQPTPLLPGVLPVGDSSAQQSPLTFCGFGSHVRNLQRTTALLDHALRRDLLQPDQLGQISAYQANVALNWVFSRFMQPWNDPAGVNRLQNIFARVLNELGVEVAVRFFRDQMTWRDYGRIVNHTLRIYKPIISTALTVLGPRETGRWIVDWLRFSGAATQATLGRQIGAARLDALEDRLAQRWPDRAFRLRARRAEWRAMGWE